MADSSNWYAKRSGAIVGWFRNNVVFRKAVVFMTALLFSHSLVDNGVVGILILYLEEKWDKANLTKVALVTNLQGGLSAVTMIVIAHISDTWTCRFMMVVYSTVLYAVGFWLLYLHAKFKSTNNVVLSFYSAMVPIAAGTAVRDPTLHAFLGDQMQEPNQEGLNQEDQNNAEERVQARVKFWSRLNEFLGAIVAVFLFGRLKWKECFEISAIAMTISGLLFLCGFPFYHHVKPTRSPITDVYYVTKAAIWKRNLDYPATNDKGELQLSPPVALLRWLDKAAIDETSNSYMSSPEEQESRGMLCPVAQVTKVKLLLTMAPMWITFFNYCLVVATGSTFFLLQISNVDDNVLLQITNGDDNVNLIFFSIIRSFSSFIASFLYELLVPRLWTETQQKRAWKVRIGVGILCSFLSCAVARFFEIYRLKVYEDNKWKNIIPMSVFWFIPQFCLLGFMEGLCEDGLVDFYYQQVPESMKAYGPPFNQWILGMGNFVSILWILTFKPWFGDNINNSRLDNYYAILAITSIANLFVYRFVSNMPIYNIDQVAEKDVLLQEILVDSDNNPVSTSFIPPSHPPSTTSTQRIIASTSFPDQSRNTGNVVEEKLSHQKTM